MQSSQLIPMLKYVPHEYHKFALAIWLPLPPHERTLEVLVEEADSTAVAFQPFVDEDGERTWYDAADEEIFYDSITLLQQFQQAIAKREEYIESLKAGQGVV